MKKRILIACEQNRGKLTVLANIYRITVPEQIYMMWPRLKSTDDTKPIAPTTRTKKRKAIAAPGARCTDKRKRIDSAKHTQQTTAELEMTEITGENTSIVERDTLGPTTHTNPSLHDESTGSVTNSTRFHVGIVTDSASTVMTKTRARKKQEVKKTVQKTRTTEDRTNRVKFHPMPRFRAGDTASQRRLLLTSRLHEASYTEDPSKPVSECQVVVCHITSVVIQNDVHDASQAQCDSELDFVMTES